MTTFRRGDRVLYSGGWGQLPPVPGTVTGHGEKNGRALLDVTLDCGARHWGYLDQFAPLPEPPARSSSWQRWRSWLAVVRPEEPDPDRQLAEHQAIARALHGIRTRPERDESELDVLDVVVSELADVLAADNPRFDRARFVEACETGRCKGRGGWE